MQADRHGVHSELIAAKVVHVHVAISCAAVVPTAPMAAIGIAVGLAIGQEVDAAGGVVVEGAIEGIPGVRASPAGHGAIGERIHKLQGTAAIAWR